ncbi:hypothetical protein BH09ACT10_BH09ACT10_29330 [soil metagenome]
MNARSLPDSLPTLAAGAHLPDEGEACVMEYVALLAGEDWTDSPRCTHPLLAFAARRTNDRISDANRSLLVPLIGRLFGTEPRGSIADQEHVIARMRIASARSTIDLLAPDFRPQVNAWLDIAEKWCDEPNRDGAAEAMSLAQARIAPQNFDHHSQDLVGLDEAHRAFHDEAVGAAAYICQLADDAEGEGGSFRVAQAYASVAELLAHRAAAQGACVYVCGPGAGSDVRMVRNLNALIDEHDLWTGHEPREITKRELAALASQVAARSVA